ncbi:MAG: ParB N-terminal domain-containing protein [Candidatus Omnitrophica bacterium]|nr:ParB N-terminal domain-containing protein [Candidatus Omnitrophota bacterium]
MIEQLKMERAVWLIDNLKEAPYNPRKMSRETFEKLKDSIRKFKMCIPLVVNKRTLHVVGGNQRLKALRELGYTEVEVVLLDISLEEEMALNLALNKISGDFENSSLPVIFQEIMKDEGLLNLTGFSFQEVFQIIDTYIPNLIDDFNMDEATDTAPVTKLGDLIELGPHKILCADSAKPENLIRLLGDEKISVWHPDLPYGVSYDAENRPKNPNKKKLKGLWKKIQNDDLVGEKYLEWCKELITNTKPFLKPGAVFYIWSGFRNFGMLTQLLIELGFYVSNVITWIKPSACPGFSDYKFASEFLLYGWLKDSGAHKWYGPKNESNVWQVEHDEACGSLHATAKPVSLARRVIKNSSQPGDIIFDSCAGAGFNLIPCFQMNRIFRGCELEPLYVDVMVKRYIRAFGMDSVSKEIRDKYIKGVVHAK